MSNTTSIPEDKFSQVEYFDNGICIHAKTGPSTVSKIYLRNRDVDAIVDMFADVPLLGVSEEDEYSDDINDAIY